MKDLGWAKEDHLDIPISPMRKSEDDPALQIPASREMSGVHVDQFRSEPDLMDAQRSQWQTVRTYVQTAGLFSGVSRDTKTFGTKLDGKKSFATHDVVSPEVKRTLYINPDGQFRSAWDIVQVFVLFYLAWVTPYRVGFDAPAYGPEFWFETLMDVYFIVDVVFNFITGFWKDMETTTVLISDAKEIALNYLRTWFIVDVVACAPVDLAMRAVEGQLACSFAVNGCTESRSVSNSNALKLFKLLRIFRLLKLLRLFRVSRLVQRYQNTLIYYHSFISIGRVNFLVILISHWVGCLFGMTHDWDDDTSKSRRWLLAVLGGAVHHFRRIRRYSRRKLLFADFVHLYHAHRCGARELDHDERAVGDESGFLGSTFSRAFAVCARVPQEQPAPFGGGKTRNHVLPWQNMNQFDEKSVLSDLPAQLRKDIFDNLYTHALQDMPIFVGCSTQFMTEVCLRMSPISFPQFQNIYCKGELGNHMYFITKGSVAVISAEVVGQPTQEDLEMMSDDCLELSRGSFFGEAAVLGYPSRLETIITTRSSTMMTLRHQDMNELCQLSSEFKAELMIIAMERIRRSKMNREVAGFALREFGLDPNEVIVGSDQGEFQEVEGRVILRSLSDLGEPVEYVDDWKELVSERVGLSVVASMPKILQSIKHLDKHISVIEDRVEALDGKKAAQSSTFSRGKLASPSEDPHGATVSARLEALETKMDLLLKLVRENA